MNDSAPTPPPADIEAASFRFDDQQTTCIRNVREWIDGVRRGTDTRRIFRLFGFAGTGKTTLARYLAADIDGRVLYAAYTGKAALIMERNGCRGASTIHALIYRARTDQNGQVSFRLDPESPAANSSLIIVDECSMVDEALAGDLMSFEVPILVLGDPAQLPPVNGKGYFTSAIPDMMLTTVHRQARDNPIIQVATDIREGRDTPYGTYGDNVIIDRPGRRSAHDLLRFDQVIVGRNRTRNAFNAKLRARKGFSGKFPGVDDRLVCLRNDPKSGLLNGALFRVSALKEEALDSFIGLEIMDEDTRSNQPIRVRVHHSLFDSGTRTPDWKTLRKGQSFDYGYALTGHKSQGSQWDSVIAYDESHVFAGSERQWLYTVITRASRSLTLIR